MNTANAKTSYLRALQEFPLIGIDLGARPEPSLEEARAELVRILSQLIKKSLGNQYGPLIGVASEAAVTEFLVGLEARFVEVKGDITLLLEEIIDRVFAKNQKSKT